MTSRGWVVRLWTLGLLGVGAMALPGCSDTPASSCTTTADCPSGTRCADGVCERPDAGGAADSGRLDGDPADAMPAGDASIDAFFEPDAFGAEAPAVGAGFGPPG